METTRVNQHLIGLTYDELIPKLEFIDDPGGGCGYSFCEESTAIPKGVNVHELVLKDCVSITYETDINFGPSRSVLNFVFTDKEGNEVVLGYELEAGSGSGWGYGAFIIIEHEGKTLAKESW